MFGLRQVCVSSLFYYYILMLSQSVLLRVNALIALRKAMTTSGRAVTDNVMRDIIKYSKSSLTDKSLAVQRAAADVRYFPAVYVSILISPKALNRSVPSG